MKKIIILSFFVTAFVGLFFMEAHKLIYGIIFLILDYFLLFLAVSIDISEKNKENKKITTLIKEMLPHFLIVMALMALLIADQAVASGAFELPLIIIIILVMIIPLARKSLMKYWGKFDKVTKREDLMNQREKRQ